MEEEEFDAPINFPALAVFVSKSEAANSIVKIARDLGVGETSPVSAASLEQLVTTCKLLGMTAVSELEKALLSLKPNAEKLFSEFFFKIRRSARASPEHLLTMLLVSAHREEFPVTTLTQELGWPEDYARDVVLAGKVVQEPE